MTDETKLFSAPIDGKPKLKTCGYHRVTGEARDFDLNYGEDLPADYQDHPLTAEERDAVYDPKTDEVKTPPRAKQTGFKS